MTTAMEEERWWQVWLPRILVAAVIAFVLEYIGKQKLPEQRVKEVDEEPSTDFSTLQYGELSNGAEQIAEDEGQLNDDNSNSAGGKNKEEMPGTPSVVVEEHKENSQKSGKYDLDDNGEMEENGNDRDGSSEIEADQGENEGTENDNANTPEGPSSATVATDAASTSNEPKKIQFKNKSSAHPGMAGFHRWYDIETSLYRQYQVGRTDGVDVYPNYVPHSRRGTVNVNLRVTNQLTTGTQVIDVYWINYKGKEDHKGRIKRGGTWHQTTWIEHPWVFRLSETNELLLHHIPDRVIQHLDEAPTCDEDDPTVGLHVFTFRPPTAQAERDHHICSIIDPILPHPASHHFHNPNQAHDWTLLHMKRQEYFTFHPGAQLLTKYLTNIVMHPDKPSYRQIRIANKNFFQGIWQTAARGLLLAAGFVEQNANAELGTADPLPSSRVQDISLVLFRLEQVKTQLEQQVGAYAQPDGADGTGRAGFGRAGEMNMRR